MKNLKTKIIKEVEDTQFGTSIGHYEIDVYCSNCGERNNVKIVRGNLIEDINCPNCGCKSLKKTI